MTAHKGPVHQGITCDGCSKVLRGKRFKCVNCDDYDLCASCEEKGCHVEHNMRW